MTTTLKPIQGTRTSLTVTGLSTLASATYVLSAVYDLTANNPSDLVLELDTNTTNTPSGNKQVVVFMQESLDNTNFRSGPTSGTTTTHEPNLLGMGYIPMNAASVAQIGTFSVVRTLGYRPNYVRFVIKNDLGVALTSGTAWTAEISETLV